MQLLATWLYLESSQPGKLYNLICSVLFVPLPQVPWGKLTTKMGGYLPLHSTRGFFWSKYLLNEESVVVKHIHDKKYNFLQLWHVPRTPLL